MSRIGQDQFVSELASETEDTGGIEVTDELSETLEGLGIDSAKLSDIAGDDGIIAGKAELGRLFDLIDTVDHNGSYRSIATTTTDAEGKQHLTASGEALAALTAEIDARRLASGGRPEAPPAPPKAPTTPSNAGRTSGLDQKQVYDDLARFEGSKSFMYQDSRGFVTTGVGHLLRTAADAEKLPWINSSTGKPATKEEIDAAFANVSDMPTGRRADAYQVKGGLVLAPGKPEELARTRVEKEFLPGLHKLYPGFDKFPVEAQRALIDMAYNCGVGGLSKFHHMNAAIASGDWATAATECHRNSCREERNEWTRDMFLQAAGKATPAL